jgi:hypothetical protein
MMRFYREVVKKLLIEKGFSEQLIKSYDTIDSNQRAETQCLVNCQWSTSVFISGTTMPDLLSVSKDV